MKNVDRSTFSLAAGAVAALTIVGLAWAQTVADGLSHAAG